MSSRRLTGTPASRASASAGSRARSRGDRAAAIGVGGFVLLLTALAVTGSRTRASEGLPPEVVSVPGGAFLAGSTPAEREYAYRLDEAAYGHRLTREQRWYEAERAREAVSLGPFAIMKNLVTNREYRRFVEATAHRAPDVDPGTWRSYGLIHPYRRTRRHAWRGGRPPADRLDHPVVLVDRADAEAYARWLSRRLGERWRLPTELEWEKAARGADGRWFPWGSQWDPSRANTHDGGPFDTMPVGSFPAGASVYGMLDPAGQVFEWTSDESGGRSVVKGGGSWDDRGCGICRPAARHTRSSDLRHILVGFRLVREPTP